MPTATLFKVDIYYCRTLSSKYERLLSQATEEIQRLSEEKARLEAAHTKLLGSNVAMAEELRELYLQQREWRDTEKVLPAVDYLLKMVSISIIVEGNADCQ